MFGAAGTMFSSSTKEITVYNRNGTVERVENEVQDGKELVAYKNNTRLEGGELESAKQYLLQVLAEPVRTLRGHELGSDEPFLIRKFEMLADSKFASAVCIASKAVTLTSTVGGGKKMQFSYEAVRLGAEKAMRKLDERKGRFEDLTRNNCALPEGEFRFYLPGRVRSIVANDSLRHNMNKKSWLGISRGMAGKAVKTLCIDMEELSETEEVSAQPEVSKKKKIKRKLDEVPNISRKRLDHISISENEDGESEVEE